MNYNKFKNKSRILASGMLTAALVLGSGASALASSSLPQGDVTTGSAALASAIQSGSQLIVALGDSITAGYEPGMSEASVPYGYVDRLKEQALFHGRAEVVNYGILGLKTDGLLNYVSAIKAGNAVTANDIQDGLRDPRLAGLAAGTAEAKSKLEQADAIVITIGGNDVSALILEAKNMTNNELAAKAAELLNSYRTNVQQTLTLLTEINPNAQIVLADQYQPVPKVAGTAVYDQLTKASGSFTAGVDELASALAKEGKQVKAVHVAEAFVGKELSLTHIFNEDVHPNQAGYEVIAKIMAQNIWGSYLETAAKLGKAEISIVVKGKELSTPYAPVLKKGQTFLALKDITDAVGGQSRWDSQAGTATITYAGRTVVIPVGAKQITADGVKVDTATPAFLHKVGKEQKTYVPLAVLVAGLGLDVQYSPKMKTVFINL
ncbi:lysophospholipase L1-like esterase [Fontibacillus phaseoli]|uniref:Lysophospholipase L1-like esterase n=1 Tax=Fontibacillus phaseoli TaxID=1416533 RepID=A0A369B3V0_9BACL|nr:GDSL-type esterase/lipase family protein [Fontibacillus phaseoli]RCX16232.1 lysophospholipase L1-like esterase [Fontibacillus phaseoli]